MNEKKTNIRKKRINLDIKKEERDLKTNKNQKQTWIEQSNINQKTNKHKPKNKQTKTKKQTNINQKTNKQT